MHLAYIATQLNPLLLLGRTTLFELPFPHLGIFDPRPLDRSD